MTHFNIFSKNMNYNDLEVIGLNENEAKIYIAIINLGESIVSRIADKAEIKRTTAYLSLRALKKKGLVGQAKKNNQMHYFAEDPKILDKIMQRNNEKFLNLMPEIASIIKLTDHQPSVCYYNEGKSYKKVYDDILNYKNQEVLSWHSGGISLEKDEYFLNNFNPERVSKKISQKTIFFGRKEDLKELGSFVKINLFKFAVNDINVGNTEIYIYSNKIGIISREENLSIIIESEGVSKMFKVIFGFLWEKI